MSSLQTTLARAAAKDAAAAWKRHHGTCGYCRKDGPDSRCADGLRAHDDHREAARAVAAELDADRRPAPGQRPLFP